MNIASVVLGLVSLGFGFRACRVKGYLVCCMGSFLSCGLALVFQLGELYRLTLMGDTAAIYDTAHARLVAAGILLGLNVGLHLPALLRGRKQNSGKR